DSVPRRHTNHSAGAVLLVSVILVMLMALGFAIFLVKFGGKPANVVAAVTGDASPDKPAPDKTAPDRPVVIKESEADDPSRPAAESRDKSVPFPRRALLISVHGYLFANPVGAMPMQAGRDVASLPDRVCNGLRIPRNQIALLSDARLRAQALP